LAASQNSIGITAALLFLAKANINAINGNGYTALMLAARAGHTEMVDLLIQVGADIEVVGKYGYTALMWAAKNRHNEIITLLLKAGANPNIVDKCGKTALQLCFADDVAFHFLDNMLPKEKAAYLLNHAEENSVIHYKHNINNTTQAAVAHHYATRLNKSALVITGNLTLMLDNPTPPPSKLIFSLIKAKHAETEYRNKNGDSALILSVRKNFTVISVALLFLTKANINAVNYSGESALILAAKQGNTDIVRLFIQFKPDLSLVDNQGYTALMWAAQNSHKKIIKLLIQAGVDSHVRDASGNTALLLCPTDEVAFHLLDSMSPMVRNAHLRGYDHTAVVKRYKKELVRKAEPVVEKHSYQKPVIFSLKKSIDETETKDSCPAIAQRKRNKSPG
jgi:ankyrin repeat protein